MLDNFLFCFYLYPPVLTLPEHRMKHMFIMSSSFISSWVASHTAVLDIIKDHSSNAYLRIRLRTFCDISGHRIHFTLLLLFYMLFPDKSSISMLLNEIPMFL